MRPEWAVLPPGINRGLIEWWRDVLLLVSIAICVFKVQINAQKLRIEQVMCQG